MAAKNAAISAEEREGIYILGRLYDSQDAAGLSWAAAGVAPLLLSQPGASAVPEETAAALAQRLGSLEADFGKPLNVAAREAGSELLGALLELARARPEDAQLVRSLLLQHEGPEPGALLRALLPLVEAPVQPPEQRRVPVPPAVAAARAKAIGVTAPSSGNTAVANAPTAAFSFVPACHLLALVAEGEEELCSLLREVSLMEVVSQRMLRAMEAADAGAAVHDAVVGTELWPFLTAGLRLLEVLATAMDPERLRLANPELAYPAWSRGSRPEGVVEASIATLKRSLLREGGSLVVQPVHLSGLRLLGEVARLSPHQARRILEMDGLALGAAVLRLQGADEEATVVALGYIAKVSASSQQAHRKLRALEVGALAERAQERYAKVAAVQTEAERVLRACDPYRTPTRTQQRHVMR